MQNSWFSTYKHISVAVWSGSCFILVPALFYLPECSKMAIFIAAHISKHYFGYGKLGNSWYLSGNKTIPEFCFFMSRVY